MGRLIAITLLACVGFSVVTGRVQLPCNSILRMFPGLSIYFEHCECTYSSNYTETVLLTRSIPVQVPWSQCESGWAVSGRGYREATGGYECEESECVDCAGKWEDIHICEPNLEEKLIRAFHLGNVGQNTNILQKSLDSCCEHGTQTESPQNSQPAEGVGANSQCRCSRQSDHEPGTCINSTSVCTDIPETAGRYSLQEFTQEEPEITSYSQTEPRPLPVDPIPFDFAKHGARYKRDSTSCEPDGLRYTLFMLDTSGTIGQPNFDLMTEALSKLFYYFCDPIKIAVMTFSHEMNIEFCFNCFENSCAGREEASEAMQNVTYRGGGTFTGKATQCACDEMLNDPKCGFGNEDGDTRCLDVIYITDGRSNGAFNVCKTISCLEKASDHVHIFAFGIGNLNDKSEAELECLADTHDVDIMNPIFLAANFEEFSEVIIDIAEELESSSNVNFCFTDSHSKPEAHNCSELIMGN